MQKILVCHTGAWIGDMVLLTPTLRALKHIYVKSQLSLLMRPLVTELMNENPYVDRCILDTKHGSTDKSLIRLIRKIRKFSFDIAVVLHPTSYRNALIPFLARIPIRIGSNYKGRGLLLTKSCQSNTNLHEVDRYLTVIQLLNKVDSKQYTNDLTKFNTISQLEFWHTDDDRQDIKTILQCEGVTTEDPLIAINLGTTWRTKQWSLNNFVEAIHKISNIAPKYKIVLTGTTEEQTKMKDITIPKSAINLVGKTNIMQLGALLERCEICLTCDSGPMHIAAAVKTPTVALFGPTDPKRHQPYGLDHTIIEKSVYCRPCYKHACFRKDFPQQCMQEITTDEVVKTLTSRLNL